MRKVNMNLCKNCGEMLVIVENKESPMDYAVYECPKCDRKQKFETEFVSNKKIFDNNLKVKNTVTVKKPEVKMKKKDLMQDIVDESVKKVYVPDKKTRTKLLNRISRMEKKAIKELESSKMKDNNHYRVVVQRTTGGHQHLNQWKFVGDNLVDVMLLLDKQKFLHRSTKKKKCNY